MEGNNEMPPNLMDMFINSTDTLRGRMINQSMPSTWNDHPPLFEVPDDRRRRRGTEQLEEDPVLLKGVSREENPLNLAHCGGQLPFLTYFLLELFYSLIQ
jgi:hypothetical protein